MITNGESLKLKSIYDEIIESNEKDKIKSLTLKSISSDKNSIGKWIRNGSYACSDPSLIQNLIDEEYLRYDGIEGKYQLTAMGAWYVESTYYNLSVDDII